MFVLSEGPYMGMDNEPNLAVFFMLLAFFTVAVYFLYGFPPIGWEGIISP